MRRLSAILLGLSLILCGCGGGGGGGGGEPGWSGNSDFNCDGGCARQNLTVADVQRVVQQAVAGLTATGVGGGTISVVDRVGNVLAVYVAPGASPTSVVNGQIGAAGGLEGLTIPSTLAAISKAGTGAFLSSQGNAFSTRTASQIVQEHFNPGERNTPGGPLFGVQFSQLLCSDVTVVDALGGSRKGSGLVGGGSAGPRPLPLGLSADPGGVPLYKGGDLVGGVGVEFDGSYTLDRNIHDSDDDPEERVALIASIGFEAPSERTAANVSVGKYLRYVDLSYTQLEQLPAELPALSPAGFVRVASFFNGQVRPGSVFGSVQSGVADSLRAGVPSANLVRGDGAPRFPSRAGTSPGGSTGLSAAEVEALLDSALVTAHRTRAAIRRPLDTPARVSIWVVDAAGVPLGFTRSQDAPVFGIDVALQKARSAALFSSPDAAAALSRAGLGGYVARAQQLLGGSAFADGRAFSARAVGNLARPFFVDGIEGNPPGPLSLPFPGTAPGASWSPFNTGAQLDLVFGNLAVSLGLIGSGRSIPDSCGERSVFGRRAANGIQIFPGGVPLYREGALIGAIGVSGDGIDQDDLIAFFGASRKGLNFVGHLDKGDALWGFNAPPALRSDLIEVAAKNIRLRYVNCPEAPFSGDNDQNVCEGL